MLNEKVFNMRIDYFYKITCGRFRVKQHLRTEILRILLESSNDITRICHQHMQSLLQRF